MIPRSFLLLVVLLGGGCSKARTYDFDSLLRQDGGGTAGTSAVDAGDASVVGQPCEGEADLGKLRDYCFVGVGQCERDGRYVCLDGTVQCDALAGQPQDELCGTTQDEDCDGEVDEAPDGACCIDDDCPSDQACKLPEGDVLAGGQCMAIAVDFDGGVDGGSDVGDAATDARDAGADTGLEAGTDSLSLKLGDNTTCGISIRGGVADPTVCTGRRWGFESSSAMKPLGPLAMTDVDFGDFHACGIVEGEAQCWLTTSGLNAAVGSTKPQSDLEPVGALIEVPLPDEAIDVAAGRDRSCAVVADGGVWCWGKVPFASEPTPEPIRMDGLDAAEVAMSGQTTCIREKDATVSCWGPGFTSVQVIIDIDDDPFRARQIGVGHYVQNAFKVSYGTGCALLEDDNVVCWGDRGFARLVEVCDPATMTCSAPPPPHDMATGVLIGTGGDIIDIGVGEFGACAVKQGGSVQCWGRVDLKYAESNQPPTYVQYGDTVLDNALDVEVADQYACAMLSTLKAMCWGENTKGELGNGEVWERDHEVELVEVIGFP